MAEKYGLVHLKVPPMFKALDFPKIIMKETVVEVKLIRERTIIGDEKPWETDDKKYRDI